MPNTHLISTLLCLILFIGIAMAATPDINVINIDSNPDNIGLPSFSYFSDGNLTLDFNVMDADAGATLTVDINYSSTNTQGTGTAIVNDLNLNTPHCADIDFTDSTSCSYDFNISSTLVSSDGNYFILMSISDGTNVDFNASDNNFMIDNTAPTLSADYNSSWQTMDANITFASADSNSGVSTIYYRSDSDSSSTVSYGSWTAIGALDLNVLFSTDGNYAFDFNVSDNAGNYSDVNTIYVLIDSTVPTVTLTPDSNTSTTAGSYEITWVGADSTSGIKQYFTSLDNITFAAVVDANITLTGGIDDSNSVYVKSQDNADNNSVVATITISFTAEVAPAAVGVIYYPKSSNVEKQKEYGTVDVSKELGEAGLSIEEINAFKENMGSKKLGLTREVTIEKTTSGPIIRYVSTFKVKVKNNSGKDLKELKIIEIIPKDIVRTASQIYSDYNFVILRDDPIIEFVVLDVSADEAVEITYSIRKNVGSNVLDVMASPIASFTEKELVEPLNLPGSPNQDQNQVTGINDSVPPGQDYSLALMLLVVIIILILIANKKLLRKKSKLHYAK
jgi:hypothetical protein